ncbi:MAG: substrate-binding domain-containing protein [Burkholderiales bacterium]|nr:substrate-binding domain-containing protein [Burkholderiales bacterium]
MKRHIWVALSLLCCVAAAQAKDIKIGLVYSKTGPLEAYAKQTQTGLMLGLDYATKGTMTVNGDKIIVIDKDDQAKPDLGRAAFNSLITDDKVDLVVGPTSSAVAMSLLSIAEEYKKVLIVDPAVADAITGEKWNRYIFRTGRNSSMDAIASAAVFDKPGVSIATLAQDYAFGRDGVKAFKGAIKNAKIVHEEYLPIATTDFTAGGTRIFDALKKQPGRKVIWPLWAGAGNPGKILDMDPGKYGIEMAAGANVLAAMKGMKQFDGAEGFAYYYFGLPKNPINNWLISEHYKRFKSPPDLFTAGGMATGIAIVEVLKKTGGDTDTEKLIKALEGLTIDTPRGKMHIRKEDHQALQSMYHVKFVNDPAYPWIVPKLVREITYQEMEVPIRNKR